mmetsp:Transcript_41357/g.76428  ORF Transcript_41357/g.76428 Transcript_41357/m.76428 type:complete len:87 (-) Transcript_41357:508-768(-)
MVPQKKEGRKVFARRFFSQLPQGLQQVGKLEDGRKIGKNDNGSIVHSNCASRGNALQRGESVPEEPRLDGFEGAAIAESCQKISRE